MLKIFFSIVLSIFIAIGVVRFEFWLFKLITIISLIALILILVYFE